MKVVWKVTLVSILVMIGILCGNNSFAEDTTCAISWTWDTTGDLEKSIIVQTKNAATTIDWGDGSTESVAASSSDLTLSHTYTSSGDYTCKISDDVVTLLSCPSNQISSIYVNGCYSLKVLNCNNNNLSSIGLNGYVALTDLRLNNNELSSIDLSRCGLLDYLECSNNQLSSIELSGCTRLSYLECSNNELSSIEQSGCTRIWGLYCNNNNLSSIDLSGCTSLEELDCNNNKLSSLDLSDCTNLYRLRCNNNKLSSIDVSSCTSLKYLYCGDNQLTVLDVTANTSLKRLCCVQPTLNVLSLTQQQAETMNIWNYGECCEAVSSNGEIHKFANTKIKISVDGVVCTEHTGGTTENDGRCTVCGVKYIGVKYYVRLDNGLVRTIFSSFPGKLIRVGFTNGSVAEFMVNTGNVTLETSGNYRTFTMPSEKVDITISK